MSPRITAKRIAERSWKIKDKIIDLKYEAEGSKLDALVERLYDAMIMMDEVIGTAERAAKQP